MPEFLSRLQEKFLDFWKNLDKSQKTRIYITAGILVVALAASIVLLTKVNYIPLISDADTKDIKEMTVILDEKGIKYKLTNDSKGILIDSKANSQAQVALLNFPKVGMTFDDAISLMKINTTESDKKQIWKQFETKDLIAKLKMLDNVADANVTLVKPEQSLFVQTSDEQKKASAIVVIKPKGELTEKQIKGIVMMVARSVEGLSPSEITVVDNNSNILNSDTGDEPSAQASSQEEMRYKKAKELEKRVYNYFNGVQSDSFDTLRVAVNPVLDFNRLKSVKNEIANPTGMTEGAPISTLKTSESLSNGSVSGEPGIGTNPGTANSPTYQVGTAGNGTYDKKSETINMDYTRITSEEEKALGVLDSEKSTMAVALWYGNRVVDDAKLTADFINQIKDAASDATGIPAANITVNKLKIAPPTVVKKAITDVLKEIIDAYGLFALMILLTIGLALSVFPKKKKKDQGQDFGRLATATSTGPKFIVPEGPIEPVPEIEFEEKNEVKKQIEKFVKQKPDAVAQLLRNWLQDEWE